MKVLIWLVVLGVVVLWWNVFRRRSLRGQAGARPAPPAAGLPADAIVPCAHCGVHLPAVEAVRSDQRLYCSPAHAEAGPRDLRP